MDYFKITTDETLRETVQHGSERYPFAYYPEDIWQFDFHRIDWHWHHELEFLYVAEGTAICFIGTSKVELHKGCGIFINSGVLHCFEARSSTFTPNIVFAPTLLASENSLIYEKYILPVINSAVEYQIFDPNSRHRDDLFGRDVPSARRGRVQSLARHGRRTSEEESGRASGHSPRRNACRRI